MNHGGPPWFENAADVSTTVVDGDGERIGGLLVHAIEVVRLIGGISGRDSL
jgi:hypothetical protein